MNAIDTNVLIYAVDSDERIKAHAAVALLDRLASGPETTVLLWQVLCEFTAFIAKIEQRGGSPRRPERKEAFAIVRELQTRFPLVTPGPEAADTAIRIHLEEQVSIWDSFLLAACLDAGVTRLYTEDVQSRPQIRGIEIVNPFA